MEAKNDNKGDIKKIQSKYILDQIINYILKNLYEYIIYI